MEPCCWRIWDAPRDYADSGGFRGRRVWLTLAHSATWSHGCKRTRRVIRFSGAGLRQSAKYLYHEARCWTIQQKLPSYRGSKPSGLWAYHTEKRSRKAPTLWSGTLTSNSRNGQFLPILRRAGAPKHLTTTKHGANGP